MILQYELLLLKEEVQIENITLNKYLKCRKYLIFFRRIESNPRFIAFLRIKMSSKSTIVKNG